MTFLFTEIIYRPLFNLVVLIYNIIPGHDFGIAIIVLTLIIRIILFPLSIKTVKSQRALSGISPKIKEIKDKFKDNKQAQMEAISKLYKDNNINPITGCLPLLIQLPILIGLYKAFIVGLTPDSLKMLYGFIGTPEVIKSTFLGIINVGIKNPILTLLAGGLQFLQAKQNSSLMKKDPNQTGNEMMALSNQMLYFFPIFIIIIGWNLPAGLMLYWITTTAFSIFEQFYVRRVV